MASSAYGISFLAVGTGDGPRRPTPPNNDSNTSPTPSEEFAYLNSGKQDIKGLTNQTGYVKGSANGAINFGTLTTSASAQRQA
ncbi:hypothetical protein E2542_SST18631 [Spatholobus suberectus]|nr:hypothetical protein E2542_SST18631 [Spatholobus suberectus]